MYTIIKPPKNLTDKNSQRLRAILSTIIFTDSSMAKNHPWFPSIPISLREVCSGRRIHSQVSTPGLGERPTLTSSQPWVRKDGEER